MLRLTWPTYQYVEGLVVGFVSTALIFSPIFFIHKHKNRVAIILASLLSILLLIDSVYYAYFKTLPTAGLLSSVGETTSVIPAIIGLLSFKYILLFVDIIFVIIFYKHISLFFKRKNIVKAGNKFSIMALLTIVVCFFISLQPMGGANNLIKVLDSGYDTVSTAQFYGIFVAHAIDVTRFIKEETTVLSPDQTQHLIDWVNNNKPNQATSNFTGVASGKNVIMIQVESLGSFVMNQSVNEKEITPNLNKLAKSSHFFPNDRFIIGAGHTSDTDLVANSSFFPLDDAATFVRYGRDEFTSLPKTLIANGYSATAYHGFNRNFWNRNVALSSLGYQKFYAADNYSDGTFLNMGLNDGDFLSETVDYIKLQQEPSLNYVITLSSHVPFNITDKTNNLGLDANDYPELTAGYLENINYTDRMLGNFFDKLKTNNLYDDSLIVVYGDHTPVLPAFTAGTVKYDPDTIQASEVPLFVKLPNETDSVIHPNMGTNLDIMPTILDLLGVKTKQLMFGRSLFVDNDEALKVCSDQLVVFNNYDDCTKALEDEKAKSALIIRYNQFNKLSK
ncbi:MAG: lipoteichoic acid synthase [Patescibacteria group bacterium]|nr:lipoteichoic acid synthase [Patescibacteria group bacterium]